MPTSVQVHGLPAPPDGCEWHCPQIVDPGETAGSFLVVARPKWEPKPGEEPAPLAVGDRVKVRSNAPANRNRIGIVSEASSCGSYFDVDFTPIGSCDRDVDHYSRCQLEKLPAEEPAIDIGEGYSRIVWDAENPPVRMEGDEFQRADGSWVGIDYDSAGLEYLENDFNTLPNRRRPIPAWTAPEWARVLGWMCEDEANGTVEFFATRPELGWDEWTGNDYIGSMSIDLAKSLNLYPPHWDTLPASERIVNLNATGDLPGKEASND